MGKLSNIKYAIPHPNNQRRHLYLFRGEYKESGEIAMLTNTTIKRVVQAYRDYPECAETLLVEHISHFEYTQGWTYKGRWYSQKKLLKELKISIVYFQRFVSAYGKAYVQEQLNKGSITHTLLEFKQDGVRIDIRCSDNKIRTLTDACAYEGVSPKMYRDLPDNMPAQEKFELAKKCTKLASDMIAEGMYGHELCDRLHAGEYEEVLREYARRKQIRDFLTDTRVNPPSISTLKRYYKMSLEEVINKTGTGRKIIFPDGTEHTVANVQEVTGFSFSYINQLRSENLQRLSDSYYAGGSLYRTSVTIQGRVWESRNDVCRFMNKQYTSAKTSEQFESAILKDGYTDRLKFEAISHEVTRVVDNLWTYKCPVCGRVVLCCTDDLIDFKHDETWCALHCVDEEIDQAV